MKKITKNLLRLWGITFAYAIVTGTVIMAAVLVALMGIIILQDAILPKP